jgi:hypothetical protein
LSRINNSVAVHHAVQVRQRSGQVARQNMSRLLRVNRAQVAELVREVVEVSPTIEDLQRFIEIISAEDGAGGGRRRGSNPRRRRCQRRALPAELRPVWLVVQRAGVEPAQPVATVLQTAPLADAVSLHGWNPVDPARFEPA